jgi:NAD(P)-dependent dehydrogenase (short-subunit alcohol dehydrogenase family)
MTQRSPVVLVAGASFGRGVATPRALAENGFEVLTPTRSGSRRISTIQHDVRNYR